MLTTNTNHLGGNLVHKHKTLKFDMVGEQPAMYIQKNVEKLHTLKSQPRISEFARTEWPETFDFPTRISVFYR